MRWCNREAQSNDIGRTIRFLELGFPIEVAPEVKEAWTRCNPCHCLLKPKIMVYRSNRVQVAALDSRIHNQPPWSYQRLKPCTRNVISKSEEKFLVFNLHRLVPSLGKRCRSTSTSSSTNTTCLYFGKYSSSLKHRLCEEFGGIGRRKWKSVAQAKSWG